MKSKYLLALCLLTWMPIQSQKKEAANTTRPSLVVGIVVDQMRWDYLRRFSERYTAQGGFKRLMSQGFEFRNAHYNYIPTVTAAGHTSIYSGTTPAIHGIAGNNWYDRKSKEVVYCTDDKDFNSSPKNLKVTTITDELRMAYQFKNKVFGLAIKDRASILPAGHYPNGAFWYDSKTGSFVTSSYYSPAPSWVKAFNDKKYPDQFYKNNWNTLYPKETYANHTFEGAMLGYYNNDFDKAQRGLPYDLEGYIGKKYDKITHTPWGNTLTVEFAKALIENEHLGKTPNATDFLAVSFSSTDIIGHAFGPNSVEIEDTYLKLDKDLGDFMSYLDQQYGHNYVLFLTADHAVNNIPEFLKMHHMPGGLLPSKSIKETVNNFGASLGIEKLLEAYENAQIYLNIEAIKTKKLNRDEVIEDLKTKLFETFTDEIAFVVNNHKIQQESIPEPIKQKIINGYNPTRSGDITIVMSSGYLGSSSNKGTSHFSPYAYDTHIPLLFFGWGIRKGHSDKNAYINDIAPTLSLLLNIQMPSGSTGKPLEEAFQD